MSSNCSECLETIESEFGIVDVSSCCTLVKSDEDIIVSISEDYEVCTYNDVESMFCPDCGAQLESRGNGQYCLCCGWQPILY